MKAGELQERFQKTQKEVEDCRSQVEDLAIRVGKEAEREGLGCWLAESTKQYCGQYRRDERRIGPIKHIKSVLERLAPEAEIDSLTVSELEEVEDLNQQYQAELAKCSVRLELILEVDAKASELFTSPEDARRFRIRIFQNPELAQLILEQHEARLGSRESAVELLTESAEATLDHVARQVEAWAEELGKSKRRLYRRRVTEGRKKLRAAKENEDFEKRAALLRMLMQSMDEPNQELDQLNVEALRQYVDDATARGWQLLKEQCGGPDERAAIRRLENRNTSLLDGRLVFDLGTIWSHDAGRVQGETDKHREDG